MIDDIKQDAVSRMAKSVEALVENLAKVRTGRAHPSMLDHVTVSYYGADTPPATGRERGRGGCPYPDGPAL